MAEHALLSASGSKKWLTCTPSARLEEKFPDEESEFAKEGTLAHDLLELALGVAYLGAKHEPLNTPEKILAAGYTLEMAEAVREFQAHCFAITDPLRAANEPFTVLVEKKLDYSAWAPEGFGTGDFTLVTKDTLYVRDFKYGKGVEVETVDNSQMMLYGLGAYADMAFAYEGIEWVDIGIIQPRIHNVTTHRVSVADLLAWGEQIKPIAEKAWAGEGEFVPGHHCSEGFCKARFKCRARTDWILANVGRMADANLMLDDEIADLIPKLDEIKKWAGTTKEWATAQAADHGVKFFGLKLVEGRSYRVIRDQAAALEKLEAAGVDRYRVMTEPELLGLTKLEEVVGKKQLADALGDLLYKPPGKPTLVSEDDKRKEWLPAESADSDFAN